MKNKVTDFFKIFKKSESEQILTTEEPNVNDVVSCPTSEVLLKSANLVQSLNSEQKKAVTSTEGYIRVIAGAGSGKTRALTYRFAYLVDELGISPNNIMSVTFTNKAAGVMKKRIRDLIGDQDTAFINTFHGFCVRVLREDIHNLNYPKQFIIIDVEDQKSLLKEVYTELKLTVQDFTYKHVLDSISQFKKRRNYVEYTTNPDMEGLNNRFLNNEQSILSKIIYHYLILQRKNYALDFDDLIQFVLYLYDIHTHVLHKWQERLEYIQVDEFQDVSGVQFELVSRLSEVHKNLFVVGDPDQTIYSWRGANIERLLNFDKQFPNVKTIFMNTNYRSTPEIIDVSNSLIRHNSIRLEKDLIPVNANNIKVLHYHAKNSQDEAEWIAKKVKVLKDFSQIVILYRAHYVSRAIEEAFLKYEINYVVHSGISFYQRQEIKDVLSYLRLIVIGDDLSFLRVINTPRRGIGTKRLDIIKEYAQQQNISLYEALKNVVHQNLFNSTGAKQFIEIIDTIKNTYITKFHNIVEEYNFSSLKIVDLVDDILKSTGYESLLMTEGDQERLDNIAELKESILSFETNAGEKVEVEDYLAKIALLTSSDRKDNGTPRVTLMTIHAVKGLEFPYVFVCGLNEGVFPSSRTRNRGEMEEERRLAYVALTRAEKALYITDAEGFHHDAGTRYPSRFIFNIPENLLEREGVIDNAFFSQAQKEILFNEEQLDNYKVMDYHIGDQIKHSAFGVGEIISIDENTDYVIKFVNCATNRNIKKEFAGLFKI